MNRRDRAVIGGPELDAKCVMYFHSRYVPSALKMHDFDIRPLASKVLGHKSPMAVMGPVFAAKQATIVKFFFIN